MEIFICQMENLNGYPPTINLLTNLTRNGHKVTLISLNVPENISAMCEKLKVKVIDIKAPDLHFKLFNKINYKRLVTKTLTQHCPEGSILWTTTDYTAVAIREVLWKYKHIMQLMELIEEYPVSKRLPFNMNLAKYARKARCVVVPEYNRAHIQKAWWNLEKVPCLLPNKTDWHPRNKKLVLSKEIPISSQNLLEGLSNRKIVLYQGAFGTDRRLDVVAEAVKLLGPDYCLVLMGHHNKMVQELLNDYKGIVYHIDYIAPPNHLYVTSYAYIGVLSYVTTQRCAHYSLLNALYCAPNKIYEYAGFALPMVGNDIPGLKATIDAQQMGVCAINMTPQAFVDAFLQVENQYEKMSCNAVNFYNSVDMDKCIGEILDHVK